MYENFAAVYDKFMSNAPYDEWTNYILEIIKKENIKTNEILDLGAGSGNITSRLVSKGIGVIGVDLSEDMLTIAKEKCPDTIFINQNIINLDIDKSFDVIICVCDTLNYITDEYDLHLAFEKISSHLNKNGILIFDLNTEHKFKNIYADNTFAYSEDDASYIWENFYDDEERINEYYVEFFVKADNDLYKKYTETHYERAYSLEDINLAISNTPLKIQNIYDDTTFNAPKDESERIFYILRKEK
ncbi:MAG: class I SAM-dependent methyltransferase [Clostridia bacterium]|jgi:ubiquinone/menaquinone biosynthesis C-methylase UbiE|nr:class I SAM-dependent methyltransferase [Clostridia bacterium]